MYRFAAAVLAFGLALTPLQAGQFNKKVNFGDPAPAFKLKGVDDQEYSLDSFKGKDVLVIVVTCNECPVARDYEDRILAFAKKYGGDKGKVGVVAIDVNLGEDETLPKMKERARAKGFNFPYLRDESQKLGRELNATATPEFYVYNKDRKLVYTGAMDDDLNTPTVNYLEAAVKAALDGKAPEKAETRVRGCGIQYKR